MRAAGLEPILCDVLDRGSLQALPAVTSVFHGIARDRSAGHSMRESMSSIRNASKYVAKLVRERHY